MDVVSLPVTVSISVVMFVVSEVEDWFGCVFVVVWNDVFRVSVDWNEDDLSIGIVFVDAVAEEYVKKFKMVKINVELGLLRMF